MNTKYPKTAILLVFVIAFAGACSVLSHNDPDQRIRAFVSDFEKSLADSDSKILDLFNTPQSKDAILAAIHVLQNKDSLHVKCQAFFDKATILTEGKEIRVTVHANIAADTLGVSMADTTSFVLYLTSVKDKLVITRIDGDAFYNTYVSVKGQVIQATADDEIAEKYVHYFAAVKSLQQSYDSVVWAVQYNHKSYFYVVKGTWPRDAEHNTAMGLVDQQGNIIVPVDFSLVCTPGFSMEGVVEVRKAGLTGYYSMDGRQILAPDYEWIMPLQEAGVYALVQKDGGIGWLNSEKIFKSGFPSPEVKKYYEEYQFVSSISISSTQQAAAEIPSEGTIGEGFIMPASYLVSNGFFDEIMGDFSIANSTQFRANTQSVDASYTFTEKVIAGVNALVKVVTKNYLEGREGFYTTRQIDFLDEQGTAIASINDGIYGDITFRQIDSTTLEIKASYIGSDEDYMMGGPPEDDREISGLPSYTYFMVDATGVPRKQFSNRSYSFTQFVKLDDDYLSGDFKFYDHAREQFDTRSTLCNESLIVMRNEILADYGYIFEDPAITEHFKYNDWYRPVYSQLEEFKDRLTDVDKFNLAFLEKKLGPIAKEAI